MNRGIIRQHILGNNFSIEPGAYQPLSLDELMMQYIIDKNEADKKYGLNAITQYLFTKQIGKNANNDIGRSTTKRLYKKLVMNALQSPNKNMMN
jgi:hypothetical protein